MSSRDFIMIDDMNFQLDRLTEPEMKEFLILVDVFNFKHVTSFTHKSANILDVIITKNHQNTVQDVDHNIIVCTILHPKPRPIHVAVNTRKCLI